MIPCATTLFLPSPAVVVSRPAALDAVLMSESGTATVTINTAPRRSSIKKVEAREGGGGDVDLSDDGDGGRVDVNRSFDGERLSDAVTKALGGMTILVRGSGSTHVC